MPINDQSHRTGCIIGDAVVVLDRRRSRYYLLADADPHSWSEDPGDGASLLSWPDEAALHLQTARQHRIAHARRAERGTDQADLGSLARLRWLEARYALRLRHGLEAGVGSLARRPTTALDAGAAARLVGSAWRARRLWPSRDTCLPRSLALTHALRAAGSPAVLVLGVALHPFAAHAWVQIDDRVVNDTIDHVALFTPIFAW